jgi:hypothetical protein
MLGFPHVAIPAAVAELAAGLSAPAGGEVETLLLLASDGDEPEKLSIDHGRQLVGGQGIRILRQRVLPRSNACRSHRRTTFHADHSNTRTKERGQRAPEGSFQAPTIVVVPCLFTFDQVGPARKAASSSLEAHCHWRNHHRVDPRFQSTGQKSTVGVVCSTLSITDYRDSEIDTTTEIVVVCSTLSIGGDARDSHGFQPFQWKRSTPNKGFVLVPSNAAAAAHRLASTVGRGVFAGTSS